MYDIGNIFLLSGLSEPQRRKIAMMFTEIRNFDRGEVIYDDTHFRHALGVFLSGSGYAGEGKAKKASFTEGDVFGAAALFGAGDSYVSRIAARTACRILFIPEETLRTVFGLEPLCAVNYVTFLSERIRYLNRKISQYTGDSAAARLYRLLDERADGDGVVADTNMSLLAGLSGMGRTSVYRAAEELEKNGLLRRENKTIIISRNKE